MNEREQGEERRGEEKRGGVDQARGR